MDFDAAFVKLISDIDTSEASTPQSAQLVSDWIRNNFKQPYPNMSYRSCKNITVDKLKWLIKNCPLAYIGMSQSNGLMTAASEADIAAVHMFLYAGADIAQTDIVGDNALTYAVRACGSGNKSTLDSHRLKANDYLCVVTLLIEAGAEVNCLNSFSETPLLIATNFFPNPNADMISILLSNGANVKVTDQYGTSPLIFVCACPLTVSVDLIDLLIAHGADCNHAAHCGNTALTMLAHTTTIDPCDAMASLINHGAEITHTNLEGQTFVDVLKLYVRTNARNSTSPNDTCILILDQIISKVECPDNKALLISMKSSC